jgi:hypothetical protein
MKNKSLSIVSILGIIGLLVFVIGFSGGCNKYENQSNSSLRLVVASITGSDLGGNDGSTTVFSDVLTSSGGIINDNATASLRAELLDPFHTGGTQYQDVIVDQIDVSYSRTDGLSVEGRDVPYSFSQKVNAVILSGGELDLPFVVVQHNAKGESPLVELGPYPNQEHVLKMEAHITFHSIDTGGYRLAPVNGTISIWFGNFADEN